MEISVEKYLSNEEEKGGIAAEDGWRFYDGERKTGLSFETTESEDAFSKVADIHAPQSSFLLRARRGGIKRLY